MRDAEANRLAIGAVAILVGVGGVWLLFLLTNYLVEQLPSTARDRVRPFVFVGPAMVILFVYLIYPIFNTFYLSLLGRSSEEFVGLANYIKVFTEPDLLITLRNNLLWIVLVTGFSVGMGLIIAVLVDRIGGWESIAKSLVFVPMAISAVGASVIWKFMYFVRAEDQTQIGLLNAIITSLGGSPVNFLETRSINNFALIVIMIWLLTGFCMVVLSAAIKGVPSELLEAARIDGANEIQVFNNVIVPVIRPTIITISTTVLIMVLKVFDIVYVMTGGRRETEVIANRMFTELFRGGSVGLGSALAIILLIAVSPVIVSNLRELRARRG
ncbi:MAG: sugar ABC transporter permease [Anaerolineae bacterium]|nr:sugar ABC transporter permease [Anaerolineae bacterium]